MSEPQDNLWQTHSLKFLEAAFRTDRHERLHNADGRGSKARDCGDTIEFFILLKGNCIHAMAYQLNGCINTNACANALIDLAEGSTLARAWEISPEEVAAALESLPGDHFHCAELVIGAFYSALADVRRNLQAPWKKLYR
ncbi:MAG: iron-sulfur cluster assembly scaffold protein [Desulfobacteraceae bacterium]|nr:MAG: iron-sulfur cluster assembly scaffold protein [Desulfobacteraceae bacterium]